MNFTKIRDVRSPERAHESDAGIDFFIPKNLLLVDILKQWTNDLAYVNKELFFTYFSMSNPKYIEEIHIPPGGRVLIPSGIKVITPKNTALIFMNKSGVSTNTGLITGAAVVDQDYRGEVHISLINTSNKLVTLTVGQKIIQGLLIKHETNMPLEISNDNYDIELNTERADGGFGHTGA
jgi:dUTP pyrophosphatase